MRGLLPTSPTAFRHLVTILTVLLATDDDALIAAAILRVFRANVHDIDDPKVAREAWDTCWHADRYLMGEDISHLVRVA